MRNKEIQIGDRVMVEGHIPKFGTVLDVKRWEGKVLVGFRIKR